MSGAGRRSAYRKALMTSILDSLPEPDPPSTVVVRVSGSRGGNILEIEVPSVPSSPAVPSAPAAPLQSSLALMPTKFNKLIWVKRGDFMIVSGTSEVYETGNGSGEGKVNFLVQHILFPEQVKHLKQVGKWPHEFRDAVVIGEEGDEGEEDEVADDGIVYAAGPPAAAEGDDKGSYHYESGEEEEEYEEADMSDMMANTNKMKSVQLQVDSESDSDDE
ncbi:hypothetical protein TeGR_g8426 [Tetraparma gracilis]|uniref:S1-like domain-containing protein n=1 Tax=Tetraparma gracilis TaxID=2962635 RepID=A0ABQ6MNZ9_9STRA|nr:hypothetical protein TeGR_g8426 [Tetraparma gracilis]